MNFDENKILNKQHQTMLKREKEVEVFRDMVNKLYSEEYGKLAFTFEVNPLGKLTSFELHELQPFSKNNLNSLKYKLKKIISKSLWSPLYPDFFHSESFYEYVTF